MKNIVIVEDSQSILSIIKFNLTKNNYIVSTATNGEEGLQLIKKQKPDLIITDLMMPVKDGLSMIKDIKANPDLKNIPIIILTAKKTAKDKIKGLGAGAVKYLYKPFEITELLKAIDELKTQKGELKVHLDGSNKIIFDLKNNLNFINEISALIDEITKETLLVINEAENLKIMFKKFYDTFIKKINDTNNIWIKIGYFFSKEKLILKIGWNKSGLFDSLEKDFSFIKNYVSSAVFDDKNNSIMMNIILKSSIQGI